MKMRIIALMGVAFIFSFVGCKKFRMEPNVPDCIQNSAKDKTKDVSNIYASILEYEFQNNVLYVFDLNAGETDARAEIYSSTCSIYGYLGGPEKNVMVNGEDFKSAVFKRRVWPLKN